MWCNYYAQTETYQLYKLAGSPPRRRGGGGKKAHISGEPRAFLRGGGGGLPKKILMAQCKEQVLYLGGFGFRKIT